MYRHLPSALTRVLQILSFVVSAAFSCLWFVRWARITIKNFGLSGDDRIWPPLGWFCGLVCVGSVAGAVAWGYNMQTFNLYYEAGVPGVSPGQQYALSASNSRLFAVFCVLYGVELFCLVIPKLMLLGRLMENTVGNSHEQKPRMSIVKLQWRNRGTLPAFFRAMCISVMVCSLVGMVALDVAAAYYVQFADILDQANAACDSYGNNTATSLSFASDAYAINAKSRTAISLQSVCEAAALLSIATVYLILVTWSVAKYRQAEHLARSALLSLANRGRNSLTPVPAVFAADADYNGRADAMIPLETSSAKEIVEDTQKAAVDQRRRLIAACALVLITFPARAAFDLLQAYSSFQDPYNFECGYCDPCQSKRLLIHVWLQYTPEFQAIVVALSSPLPLSVSLWLMMSPWERRHMRLGVDQTKTHEQRQAIAARARLGVDMLRPVSEVLGRYG